jgi:glycerophosphoryl diester phosphodiesterase
VSRPSPLVIGHRGAPAYRPEHTRSSYELAFALGVDAVEPDVVVSRDGVLVVRHENEISGTTDVSDRPEFADRRTTRTVDGEELAGWFTEDFDAAELATLRCRERLPHLRPGSAAHDDTEPVLTLRQLLDLVRAANAGRERPIGVVLEIKHATYFAGRGWDLAALVETELRAAGWSGGDLPLVIESFEQTVLAGVRERGIRCSLVYLLEAEGRPVDLVAALGDAAPTYRDALTPEGLDALVGRVDGISVDKSLIAGAGADAGFIADAHARGLRVFTWTCRPENAFLEPAHRGPGAPEALGRYADEWTAIRDAGIDGVFVDHPDLGAAFFRR